MGLGRMFWQIDGWVGQTSNRAYVSAQIPSTPPPPPGFFHYIFNFKSIIEMLQIRKYQEFLVYLYGEKYKCVMDWNFRKTYFSTICKIKWQKTPKNCRKIHPRVEGDLTLVQRKCKLFLQIIMARNFSVETTILHRNQRKHA